MPTPRHLLAAFLAAASQRAVGQREEPTVSGVVDALGLSRGEPSLPGWSGDLDRWQARGSQRLLSQASGCAGDVSRCAPAILYVAPDYVVLEWRLFAADDEASARYAVFALDTHHNTTRVLVSGEGETLMYVGGLQGETPHSFWVAKCDSDVANCTTWGAPSGRASTETKAQAVPGVTDQVVSGWVGSIREVISETHALYRENTEFRSRFAPDWCETRPEPWFLCSDERDTEATWLEYSAIDSRNLRRELMALGSSGSVRIDRLQAAELAVGVETADELRAERLEVGGDAEVGGGLRANGSVSAAHLVGETAQVGVLAAGGADFGSVAAAGNVSVGGTLYGHSAVFNGTLVAEQIITSGRAVVNAELGSADNFTVRDVLTVGKIAAPDAAAAAGAPSPIEIDADLALGSAGRLACAAADGAQLELCGADGAVKLDAPKTSLLHIGGVLKVKLDDSGLHVYGTATFHGSSTFDGEARFANTSTFEGPAAFNGNVTHRGRVSLQGTTSIEGELRLRRVEASLSALGAPGQQPCEYEATANGLSGRVAGDVLPRGTCIVHLNNAHVTRASTVLYSVADCNASEPITASVTPLDGVARFRLHARETCQERLELSFLVIN